MWVLLGLACLVLVGWFGHYPCRPDKLRYAFWFGAEERAARRTLNDGRAESKRIRDDAEAEFGTVTTADAERLSPLDKRLEDLRGQQEALQAEARAWGDPMGDPLGPSAKTEQWLQLYEHALVPLKYVRSEAGEPLAEPDEPLPLLGLDVHPDRFLDHWLRLRVTPPSGQNRERTWLYPDERDWALRLNDFVESANKLIGDENGFRARLQERETENAHAIRQAEAERRIAAEKGRREVGGAEQRRQKEHSGADVVRDEAYDAWVDDAGGLRPWW